MKKLQWFVCFFTITQLCMAQLFGSSQLINAEAGNIYEIKTVDLDDDGYKDIVITASNLVAWYKNIDGQGSFSAPIPIQEGMTQGFSFVLADINNDEAIDIVVSFFGDDVVVWYKNNGDGTFSSLQVIASGLSRARGVTARDLDGDDDLDLVLGVSNGTGLYWVENLDGEGDFSELNVIDATIPQARTQCVEDIDGDGDMDILTNSGSGLYLSWFENVDGQGSFTVQHIIDTVGLYANTIYLADLDGDDDVDIINHIGETISWRENIDGLGNFGPKQHINTASTGGFSSDNPADLDNDGDLDLLFGSIEVIRLGWHENLDGLGSFGPQEAIDTVLANGSQMNLVDIDNDGDLDLVASSLVANGEKFLVWFENFTILGINDLDIKYTVLYPNPAKTVLSIDNTTYIKKVAFYNTLGQELLTVSNNFKQIDISSLPNGLLLVEIETELGKLIKKLIKE